MFFQSAILWLPDTLITLDELYGAFSCYFIFFLGFKSPHLLQLFRRIMQHCFVLKLNLPSTQGVKS